MDINDGLYKYIKNEGYYLDYYGYKGKKQDREQMFHLIRNVYSYDPRLFDNIKRIIIAYGGMDYKDPGEYVYEQGINTVYLNIPAFYDEQLDIVEFSGIIAHEAMHSFSIANFNAEINSLKKQLVNQYIEDTDNDLILQKWNYKEFNLAFLFLEYIAEVARYQYLLQTEYAADYLKGQYRILLESLNIAIQQIPRYIKSQPFLQFIRNEVLKNLS